jgi:hypothetical protein
MYITDKKHEKGKKKELRMSVMVRKPSLDGDEERRNNRKRSNGCGLRAQLEGFTSPP